MATGAPIPWNDLLGNAPSGVHRGPDGSLFLCMRELGGSPASGRLLRGLTPWLDSQGAQSVFLFAERRWREPWSEAKTPQPYQELVHWARDAGGGTYRGAAWLGTPLNWNELVPVFEREPASLVEYTARRTGAAVVSNIEPLRLGVHYVPKPWGREGWYTGIEKRGLSRVTSSTGETALPYALGMFPWPLLRQHERTPILLKTLEPHPDEVLGDMYLEVHQEKWETYAVLDVDPLAWPDGVGFLRAGLDPGRIERFRDRHGEAWREALTRELRERVRAYEQVRNAIDAILEDQLRREGADPAQPVAPRHYRELLGNVPTPLREQERRRRLDVDECLGRVPLRVGDVVALPPGVLHSLQHGIKVVEFQTATYERLIALFTQKVLTQSHWDTDRALERMEKSAYVPPVPVPVLAEEGITAERVVSYPEFTVDRVRLERGRAFGQETADRYRLLFAVEGNARLRLPGGLERPLAKEDALLIPATLGRFEVATPASADFVYLLATPTAEPAED
jgi:quercetin dioxygenase-like cupin family protein